MTTIPFKIQHRVVHNTLESNLVYPRDNGYYYIAQLDEKWVRQMLKSQFRCTDINNKYAVELEVNTGRHILVANHDGKYYLIEKSFT